MQCFSHTTVIPGGFKPIQNQNIVKGNHLYKTVSKNCIQEEKAKKCDRYREPERAIEEKRARRRAIEAERDERRQCVSCRDTDSNGVGDRQRVCWICTDSFVSLSECKIATLFQLLFPQRRYTALFSELTPFLSFSTEISPSSLSSLFSLPLSLPLGLTLKRAFGASSWKEEKPNV